MNREVRHDEHRTGDSFVRFIDWLNHKLTPALGPPNVGPYNEIVAGVGEAVCPVCDRPMLEHSIDRSTPNALLDCPVEHKPVVFHDEELNELGMPKHIR